MGGAVSPPSYLTWDQTIVEVMKIMATSFKRFCACNSTLSTPWPCSTTMPTHAYTRDPWTLTGKSGSVSCGITAPFSWVLVHTGFICAFQESVSTVLCKFQWLYGGVNGDLLQEGLCHTQVWCTQSPCPCGRLVQTHTSTGDTETPKGRSGSVSVRSPGAQQFFFEPSEPLWPIWGLIPNVIAPLLPSGWGFSFALGRGVSFFGGTQQSPLDGCSAGSYNFGVLTGEDERTSFFSAILTFLCKMSPNLYYLYFIFSSRWKYQPI